MDKIRGSKNRDLESIIGEDSGDGDVAERTDVYGKLSVDDPGRSNSLNPIESRDSLSRQGQSNRRKKEDSKLIADELASHVSTTYSGDINKRRSYHFSQYV